jgi:hypothetical protein
MPGAVGAGVGAGVGGATGTGVWKLAPSTKKAAK